VAGPPDYPDLLDEVLEWFDAEVDRANRCTSARASDRGAIERLGRFGYVRDRGAPWPQLNRRGLEDLEMPALPSGFRLRTAAEVDPGAAVAVHRAAWHPFEFSLDGLHGVHSTWPYRDDPAVFIEAPDGSFVASALL
jgi:hypothetical protein